MLCEYYVMTLFDCIFTQSPAVYLDKVLEDFGDVIVAAVAAESCGHGLALVEEGVEAGADLARRDTQPRLLLPFVYLKGRGGEGRGGE